MLRIGEHAAPRHTLRGIARRNASASIVSGIRLASCDGTIQARITRTIAGPKSEKEKFSLSIVVEPPLGVERV